MKHLRSIAPAFALAFLMILDAAPMGETVPIPSVGGEAHAATGAAAIIRDAIRHAFTAANSQSGGCNAAKLTGTCNVNPPGDGYGTPSPEDEKDRCAMYESALEGGPGRPKTQERKTHAAIAALYTLCLLGLADAANGGPQSGFMSAGMAVGGVESVLAAGVPGVPEPAVLLKPSAKDRLI